MADKQLPKTEVQKKNVESKAIFQEKKATEIAKTDNSQINFKTNTNDINKQQTKEIKNNIATVAR